MTGKGNHETRRWRRGSKKKMDKAWGKEARKHAESQPRHLLPKPAQKTFPAAPAPLLWDSGTASEAPSESHNTQLCTPYMALVSQRDARGRKKKLLISSPHGQAR